MLIIDIGPDGETHETVIPDPEVVDGLDTAALAEALAQLPPDTLDALKQALGLG